MLADAARLAAVSITFMLVPIVLSTVPPAADKLATLSAMVICAPAAEKCGSPASATACAAEIVTALPLGKSSTVVAPGAP